jgi:signal transduction histidine kinase
MRHRVEAARGKLTVSSQSGKGTKLIAMLPARLG